MKLSPNDPCPCGSGLKHKRCCRPILKGAAAPTPEALMRSRYVAYALGDVDHLMATTHPDGPWAQGDAAAWRDELRASCEATRFTGLTVHAASEAGDEGSVTFTAAYEEGGRRGALREQSRFLKVGGRWLYHSGVAPAGALGG